MLCAKKRSLSNNLANLDKVIDGKPVLSTQPAISTSKGQSRHNSMVSIRHFPAIQYHIPADTRL